MHSRFKLFPAFQRSALGISLLVGAGALGVAVPARARVIRSVTVHNKSVPANGVLVVDGLASVRVLAQNGTEVPGEFVAQGIWRPHQPFEEGTYFADLSVQEGTDIRVFDREFVVTPALTFSDDMVEVIVNATVEHNEDVVLERVCCLEGEAAGTEPCEATCAPLCTPITYESKLVVGVYGNIPHEDLALQLEVGYVTPPIEGDFPRGTWEVDGTWNVEETPDELCGVVEVFSWLGATSTAVVRRCVPSPLTELGPVPVRPDFGSFTECMVPPLGYEVSWCGHHRNACENLQFTREAEQYPDIVEGCKHYAQLCGPEQPSSLDTTSTGDQSSRPSSASGLKEPTDEQRNSQAAGCSVVRLPHAEPQAAAPTWLRQIAVLMLAGMCAMRRRCPRVVI